MIDEYKEINEAIQKEIESMHKKFVRQAKKKCHDGEFKVKLFETTENDYPPITYICCEYTIGGGEFMGTIDFNVYIKHQQKKYVVNTFTCNCIDYVEPLKNKIVAYLNLLGYVDTYAFRYC